MKEPWYYRIIEKGLLQLKRQKQQYLAGEGEYGGRIDEMPILELDFSSIHSYICLKREQINTVGELCEKTRDDMMRIRALGRRTLEDIENCLLELGLHLKNEDVEEV